VWLMLSAKDSELRFYVTGFLTVAVSVGIPCFSTPASPVARQQGDYAEKSII